MKIRLVKPSSLCPFDNKPCLRPLSPIDGDLQCGGMYRFSLVGDDVKETVLVPVCERSPLE